MARHSYKFEITGTIDVDDTDARTALLPLLQQILRKALELQNLEPVDEAADMALSSTVLAEALSVVDSFGPDGLVTALIEHLVPADLERRVPGACVGTMHVVVHPSS